MNNTRIHNGILFKQGGDTPVFTYGDDVWNGFCNCVFAGYVGNVAHEKWI